MTKSYVGAASASLQALLAKLPPRALNAQGYIPPAQMTADAATYGFYVIPPSDLYGSNAYALTKAQGLAMFSAASAVLSDGDDPDLGRICYIVPVASTDVFPGEWATTVTDNTLQVTVATLTSMLGVALAVAPPVDDGLLARFWHWIEGIFGYGPNATPGLPSGTVTVAGAVSGLFTKSLVGCGGMSDAVGSLSAVMDSPVLRKIQTPMTLDGRPFVFEESDWRKLIRGHRPTNPTAQRAYARAKTCLDLPKNRAQLDTVMAAAKKGNPVAQESILTAAHGMIVRMKMGAEKVTAGVMRGDAQAKAIARGILEKASRNPNDVKASTEARLITDNLSQQRAIGANRFTSPTSL